MTRDMLLGITIMVIGLVCMTYLIWWSRQAIHRIAKMQSGTLREIMKELRHGR